MSLKCLCRSHSRMTNQSSFRYDRDEETESETKIRMPQDEYDNMESAGKVAVGHDASSADAIETILVCSRWRENLF